MKKRMMSFMLLALNLLVFETREAFAETCARDIIGFAGAEKKFPWYQLLAASSVDSTRRKLRYMKERRSPEKTAIFIVLREKGDPRINETGLSPVSSPASIIIRRMNGNRGSLTHDTEATKAIQIGGKQEKGWAYVFYLTGSPGDLLRILNGIPRANENAQTGISYMGFADADPRNL